MYINNKKNNFCNTIHFVFSGTPLPDYINSSIKLAKKLSGMKIHLITDKKNINQIDLSVINFTALDDFYDKSFIKKAEQKILFNKSFKNNFWVRTVERYFILYQFFKKKKLSSIFHAELDQLLFGINELVLNLEKTKKKGIFMPFRGDEKVINSIFFCNDLNSLNSLLNYAMYGPSYHSEMDLFFNWASKNPNLSVALPTMAGRILGPNVTAPKNVYELPIEDLGGVVDACEVGWWVAGCDPAQIPINILPRTKYFNEFNIINEKPFKDKILLKEHLQKFNFKLSIKKKELKIIYDRNIKTRIYNLHIHSKIHQSLINSESSLLELFELANQNEPVALRSLRIIQLREFKSNLFKSINSSSKILSLIKRIVIKIKQHIFLNKK